MDVLDFMPPNHKEVFVRKMKNNLRKNSDDVDDVDDDKDHNQEK